jgi:hypothetical protein
MKSLVNILGMLFYCLPAAGGAFAAAGLVACSSLPAKLDCKEIQARMDYGRLSEDQLRFAQMELDDCRQKLKQAEIKDSTRLEGLEKAVSPASNPQ